MYGIKTTIESVLCGGEEDNRIGFGVGGGQETTTEKYSLRIVVVTMSAIRHFKISFWGLFGGLSLYISIYNQITGSRATAAVLTRTGERAFGIPDFAPAVVTHSWAGLRHSRLYPSLDISRPPRGRPEDSETNSKKIQNTPF